MEQLAQDKPTVRRVGRNETPIWGMTSAERVRRLAAASGMAVDDACSGTPVLLINLAFAFDPLWLHHIAANPGKVVTFGGRAVLAHVTDPALVDPVVASMNGKVLPALPGHEIIAFETGGRIYNEALRKLETPFIQQLEPANVPAIERASYFGAYKGVTDLLTKYLWPEWALVLTRIAARLRITPNMVTVVGVILCILATFAFADGRYWLGMAMGLVFMVLDTVDGKLARCTITSSRLGDVLDHGVDLIHPPFWWYAWGVGLSAWGLALSPQTFWTVMALIMFGYVVQRLIEGIFIQRYGMHIHVWEKLDSDFRLITARRNPNMVILFASMLFARPDLGLIAVAIWTILSLIFHAVRLVQAEGRQRGGQTITSWLQ